MSDPVELYRQYQEQRATIQKEYKKNLHALLEVSPDADGTYVVARVYALGLLNDPRAKDCLDLKKKYIEDIVALDKKYEEAQNEL